MEHGVNSHLGNEANSSAGDAVLRDVRVFGELAQRSYGATYMTALAIVRDNETAQDLTQETFLRAWLKIDTLRDAELIQPWLDRIVRNLATQWLRAGQRRSRVLPLISMEESIMEPADKATPDPRQAAGHTEAQGQLADAVMALPEDLRQVVLLHHVEGMSPSEIARLNGEAVSTVTRRLDKARSQLRRHLESELATGLAALGPRARQSDKVLAMLSAVVAVPAATHAQVLHLIADTPPAPMIDPATLAAHAASPEKAGLMKTIIAKVGASKLIAGTAAAAIIAGGAYTVEKITADSNHDSGKVEHIQTTTTQIETFRSDTGNHKAPRPRTKTAERRVSRAAVDRATTGPAMAPERIVSETTSSTVPTEFVTVKGLAWDKTTSQPLANVLVRAAAPATDMRKLRSKQEGKIYPETRTDDHGAFQFNVPLSTGTRTLSLDAFLPGYRSLSGTWMSGGDWDMHNIPVSPGQIIVKDFGLPKAIYISGKITDENGDPVADALAKATLKAKNGMAFVADAESNANGQFEIFDFPETSLSFQGESAGVVKFTIADRVTTSIPDIYQLTEAERTNLNIVLKTGSTLNGKLMEASGNPASELPMHVQYGKDRDKERRDVVTDKGGYFTFKGLPAGKPTLYARSMALDQKLKTEITVPATGDLNVTMLPAPSANTSAAVTLLGMKLINVTPELAEKYDLYFTSGVLVLNPGTAKDRIEISDPKYAAGEGDAFFMAGEKPITNLNEFVAEILRVNNLPAAKREQQEGGPGHVRVVYNMNHSRSNSSMTTYIKLTTQDIRELEQFLNGG